MLQERMRRLDADLLRDCQERGMQPEEYELLWMRQETEEWIKVCVFMYVRVYVCI